MLAKEMLLCDAFLELRMALYLISSALAGDRSNLLTLPEPPANRPKVALAIGMLGRRHLAMCCIATIPPPRICPMPNP